MARSGLPAGVRKRSTLAVRRWGKAAVAELRLNLLRLGLKRAESLPLFQINALCGDKSLGFTFTEADRNKMRQGTASLFCPAIAKRNR